MRKGRSDKLVKTPKQFEALADAYFAKCKADEVNFTITGLALALGFNSRQSIYDYGKKKGFSEVVSRANLMVEHGYELRLDGASVTGPIFALKNMGWSDRQQIEYSEKVTDTGENDW